MSKTLHTHHARLVADAVTALRDRAPRARIDTAEADALVSAITPTLATDPAHDGEILGADGLWSPHADLDSVEPVLPDNGAAIGAHVILVNGVMTDVAIHQKDLQGLANTGCSVVGVRNATHGLLRDLLECVQNKLDRGDTPAITTLAGLIERALEDKKPIHVVGHSQGGLIIARALQLVEARLEAQGHDRASCKRALAAITVETYGAASNTYVDGPCYRHCVNLADLVPMLAGVGLDALNPFGRTGEGATVDTFVHARVPRGVSFEDGISWAFVRAVDKSVHGPRDVYFAHRTGAR